MTALGKYREIIKRSADVESYVDASKIVNAYDKLNELGSHELDDLLFEYARVGIKNKYLKASIDDYLYLDEEWLFKLAEYRSMFDIIDEYSEEVFAEVKNEELLQGNKDLSQLKCFRVFIDDVGKSVKWAGEKIVLPIFEGKKIVLKFEEKVLVEYERVTALGFMDKDEDEPTYEDEDFIVKVKRGIYEDKLIISPK
jgi:hypothetical protein